MSEGIEIDMEKPKEEYTPEELAKLRNAASAYLCMLMGSYLDDARAINFVTIGVIDKERGDFEVTVRRATGKTPGQVLGEYKEENERLVARVRKLEEDFNVF